MSARALRLDEMAAVVEEEQRLARPSSSALARQRGLEERDALRVRLQREGAWDLSKKLDDCGSPLGLVCCNCGAKKHVEVMCRRRWCPACAWFVQRERMDRFRLAAACMRWPLFVTLTMQNSADPEVIRELRAAWGRMRRRKLIESKIGGGISTIEVTNTGNGWHPHLHILCDCKWLALHVPPPRATDSKDVQRQKFDHARLELSALWASVLKQDEAVVLAKRTPADEALIYALKYAVKGSDLLNCEDEVAPLIRVLSKSRMVSAFGSLHGKIPVDPEDETPICLCPECAAPKSWIPQDVEDYARRSSYDKSHAIR